MRVAGIQFDIAWEDPAESVRRLTPLAEAAAGDGAELLVLPELSLTGFSMAVRELKDASEAALETLQALAQRLGVYLIAGTLDHDAGCTPGGRNLAVAISRDGSRLGTYQKIHPFSFGEEHRHYHGGHSLLKLALGDLRVTPFICYDLRFPEVFRAAADDTDLLVVIANWPRARRHAWRSLLVARAIENQCYLLGVNRCGQGGGLDYSGDSRLIDPLGELLSEQVETAGLVTGEVSAAEVARVRAAFPFLKDRRPQIYAGLKA